jgi:peptidylprolyl isomerase domain and WD repeat-containing protein 1
MSEVEENVSLGKRARDEAPKNGDQSTSAGAVPEMPPADMDDSSDEEIGPMPTGPSDTGVVMSNGRKKKRAGECKGIWYGNLPIHVAASFGSQYSPKLTMTRSAAPREVVLGASAGYGSILQEFHAQGYDQLCGINKVSKTPTARNSTWTDDQEHYVDTHTTLRTNFVITTSTDGHLKLWKKQDVGIEFVKHYRASLKAIVAVSVSEDGKYFATVSEGGEGRVFDVVNFGE